jgi:COP9 signalosome complex subunit 4
MEALTQTVSTAIQSSDYSALSLVFTSQWQSLGQGEQRSLASHFIKTAVASPTFFPTAFASQTIMSVITATLSHLPPTVEGAADNILRQRIFDYKVNEEEDYSTAARILSGLRMEANDVSSVYYMSPIERCDVFVKVAECYLEEDLTVEAEGAVTKAGNIIENSGITIVKKDNNNKDNDDDNDGNDDDNKKAKNKTDEATMTLLLRYKSTYARVLDANRKFLPAATKYHDLSTAYLYTDAIDEDDLLVMLGKAVTCAILSPNSAQRQR